MNALTPEQRAVHHRLEGILQSALVKVHELCDGCDFEFPLLPSLYKCLTEITPLEHACCPFFVISIRLDQNKLFWQLTGSDGVKSFIRMEFADWFRS